jgi:CheY-like chemotaxis protein
MQKGPFPAALAGAHILIVEDEFLVAMDFEDWLRREGRDVIGPVPRETKALALLEQDRPDAVVLDLNLDGKLPVDLANTLVARQIPFVIVTGYGNRHLDVPACRKHRGCISQSRQKNWFVHFLTLSPLRIDCATRAGRARRQQVQLRPPKRPKWHHRRPASTGTMRLPPISALSVLYLSRHR